MSKTAEFDDAGNIKIDGYVFDDPMQARKYMKHGLIADEALITRDYGGNITENLNPPETALRAWTAYNGETQEITYRTELWPTQVSYSAEFSVEQIDHVLCLDFEYQDSIPAFGNVKIFFS